jgi:hypothetical protein
MYSLEVYVDYGVTMEMLCKSIKVIVSQMNSYEFCTLTQLIQFAVTSPLIKKQKLTIHTRI